MRASAAAMRASSDAALSSVQSRSSTKACSSLAACATRSCRPSGPRTVRCAARSRRSLNASRTARTKAIAATPAAASATMPCTELRSSTGAQASTRSRLRSRALPSEDRRVLLLVVVGLLLAGDRLGLDRDGDVLARRGLLVERDLDRLRLARGDRRDAVVPGELVPARAHRGGDRDIGLGVLALVL